MIALLVLLVRTVAITPFSLSNLYEFEVSAPSLRHAPVRMAPHNESVQKLIANSRLLKDTTRVRTRGR
jgi:hypothetical protein